MSKYPRCKYNHKDCFALMADGGCFCLCNTNFKKDCTFYRPSADVEKERENDDPAINEYLIEHGFYLRDEDKNLKKGSDGN